MTKSYYNKDYIDKCIGLINNNLQLINDKLSYYSTTDKEITNKELFLFQNVISNIQDCLCDIKDECDYDTWIRLEMSLDALNYYYQNNPLLPIVHKRRSVNFNTKPTTNAHKEPTTEMSEEKKKDIIEGLDFLFD